MNPSCKDALCHYELAWPPGERPTRPQWMDCASHTLNALGYRDHQYMVVAHDDKKHFHIHIMVNKVHPETFKAHTPYRNWLTLDAAMRVLEAKYGWTHTAGPTRWDEQSKQAVRASYSERNALRTAGQQPKGAAAKYEHYHDEESLQTYMRREVAPRVRTLLTHQNVSWEALHTFLAKYHLRIEKGESGGYTVLAVDHNIRVKASDVFRHNFAGKENRKVTEQLLGPWREPSTSLQSPPANTGRTTVRNQALRDERREQRRQDRKALLFEYNQYRNQQRAVCKGITAKGRENRQQTVARLKQRKREIRALAQPWPTKKILLSEAVAASIIELRTFKLSTQKTRQAQFPKNLRTWVAERASEGDVRAAAQLREWRYADQRNQRRLDTRLEANALHLGPAADEERSDWSEFMQQRLAAQQRAENLAGQIATARIWTINRSTGDVSYTLNGMLSVIDADASSPFSTRIKPPSSSDWRWPSRNTDRASRVTAAWSGSGWSRRLRRNKASLSNSLTQRCSTPCVFFNAWQIHANASRKEAAGSPLLKKPPVSARDEHERCAIVVGSGPSAIIASTWSPPSICTDRDYTDVGRVGVLSLWTAAK